MDLNSVAGIGVVAVVAGVIISLAMILVFFWLVYDRGGPKHVRDVAKALRKVYDPRWPRKLLGTLPARRCAPLDPE